ncbi:MAG: DNA topoisomerase 3 [Muribaculaceae bacterium]|nr:DNA topoisomerase 3 [Muribaculum sp.]MCM1295303.1 DNA topoisomerase 3 [Muribaculaceae bacterium]
MIVCITEKPSVAKDIAQILGANIRRDGYYEGGEYFVTWTFGHLCTLKEPADYTERWKRWSLGVLPMIPEKFGIKIIQDSGIERQFKVIETLINKADKVINCGDAGQEGELIQRWVMQKAGIKCPVYRLWISSLTDESIKAGFSNLRPEQDFNSLYYAGLSRAIGDWILGMNATRLYSLKYSSPGNVLSIGRVQTPTLALIVQRQTEIENFKPEDFWELRTVYRDVTFNASTGRFKDIDEANKALAGIVGKSMVIKDVQEKKGREAPPRLFDLTSLQVECNKKWGWSADDTLRLIQSLYEKKVTTYPRVDTTYLSEDIYPKVPGILKQMTPYAPLTEKLVNGKIPKSKKVFDNSKVTDHHAIIPTGQSPTVLVGDERKLYHLIALRFIAAFYPDCQFLTTNVIGEVDKTSFKTSGKVIDVRGWREVLEHASENNETVDDENNILPSFRIGESGPQEPSLVKKTTQPPKYYTEGSLLRAMESAGRTIDDEELREAMKDNGIGRPSTRAAIIETLFKRKYINRVRKSIVATQAGIDLISTINEELLKSAKLTGLWENKLRRIERGEYSASDFISELKTLINDIVINVLNDNSHAKIIVDNRRMGNEGDSTDSYSKSKDTPKPPKPRTPRITKFEQIVCPICGKGYILKGNTAYGCSRFREGCTLRLNFDSYPNTLTPGKLNKLLQKYKNVK